MDTLVWLRVGAAAGADLSLAGMCGLLLAAVWLGKDERTPLRWCAAILCAASWVQLLLMAAAFSEHASLRAIMAVMPDLIDMHAGAFSLGVGGLSSGLLAWVWVVRRGLVQRAGAAVLLAAILTLRAGMGHAAVDGAFSRAEVLELAHLCAMAIWGGGVLVSGVWVAPRLVGGGGLRRYMGALSRVSTWAVGVVIASGVWKGYLAADGDLHVWRDGAWGWVLVAKAACVAGVLALGAWNRWTLGSERWEETGVVRTLRAEAWGMGVILVLSAVLANVAPPGG